MISLVLGDQMLSDLGWREREKQERYLTQRNIWFNQDTNVFRWLNEWKWKFKIDFDRGREINYNTLEELRMSWTSYNRGNRTNFSLHGYTDRPRCWLSRGYIASREDGICMGGVEFQNSKGSMRIALKTLRMKLYLPSRNPSLP